MGFFDSDSDSTSTQKTDIKSANQQGISGLSTANGGHTLYKYRTLGDIEGGTLGKSQNKGTILDSRSKSAVNGSNSSSTVNTVIKNANSNELARIAADLSYNALSFYDAQSRRSLELAEKVAVETTASNQDVISKFAKITEKANQSEALTLNEQILKYGVIALIGFFIFQGVRSA